MSKSIVKDSIDIITITIYIFTNVVLMLFVNFSSAICQVSNVLPPHNALNQSQTTVISVRFDREMNSQSINDSTFWVNSRESGYYYGNVTYDPQTRSASFVADIPFKVGELVNVVLTADIKSMDGTSLGNGYSWSFRVGAKGGRAVFQKTEEISLGPVVYPIDMVSSDFNMDGLPDLAFGSNGDFFDRGPDFVSVAINQGMSDFFVTNKGLAGDEACCIYSNDFDRDGNPDIAAVSFRSDSMTVLFNKGDGKLNSVMHYRTGDGPIWITGGDLNNDGAIDLVVSNIKNSNVFIYFNDGQGNFDEITIIAMTTPRGLLVCDLNNDGQMDWVSTNIVVGPDSLTIFLNEGNGLFKRLRTVLLGEQPVTVWGGDFNNDGYFDLIAPLAFENRIIVLFNDNDMTFSASQKFSTNGETPIIGCVKDFNGDGYLDFAVTNTGYSNKPDSTVAIFINSRGIFSEPQMLISGSEPKGIASADFDSDGDMDLAVVNSTFSSISIFINDNITSVDDPKPPLPQSFTLSQNYPNPFNPATQIEFEVPERGQVSLKIFNLSGQLVRTLKNEMLSPGTYSVTWDGRDDFGKDTASSVYLYRMRIGELSQTRKMFLIR